jgi:hypothetical protein
VAGDKCHPRARAVLLPQPRTVRFRRRRGVMPRGPEAA